MIREIFTRGTRKNNISRAVIIMVLCGYLLALFWTVFTSMLPRPFADFPCAAVISQDGCLEAPFRPPDAGEGNIEVYLSISYHFAYGAGCTAEVSRTDEISIENHVFRRDGENLVIDGRTTVGKGEQWEGVRTISFWNPWRVEKERSSVTNHGVISCVDGFGDITPYGPTLVAIGGIKTYVEPNLVGLFLLVVLLVVLSLMFLRRAPE